MLGKGLEALIPKKKQSDGVSGNTPAAPAGHTAVPPPAPPSHHHRPEEALLLGDLPKEPMLPSSGHEKEKLFEPPPQEPYLPKPYEAVFHIEVDRITPNPHQPRRTFPEESIKELAASIREFGVLQPIVVTKVEREVPTGTVVEYQLIAGERRLMAAKLLGLPRIPAIIRNVAAEQERLELAIIENLQREDLNPVEMARAFSRLQDEFRMTQREIASRLGKSRESVANTLRLLDLPPSIQKAVEEGKISESHGRFLLAVSDPAARERLFKDLLERHLTTRELKHRVKAAHPARREEPVKGTPEEIVMLERRLSKELQAPVKILRSGDTGKITISFYSEEELRGILERLGTEE
jgi:ParB family chromosome partitioning protein